MTPSIPIFSPPLAGGQTVFSRTADGLRVEKSLSCGKSIAIDYGADPQYSYMFVRQATETVPSGLTKTSSFGRTYADSNGDGAWDRITATQTENGNVSTVVDDTLAGTKVATSPAGRTVTFTYDPANLLTSRISIPGLDDISYGYDARGRLSSIATGARRWAMAYDSTGNLSSLTDPRSRTTTYSHDAVGRLTAVVKPGRDRDHLCL